MSTTARQKHEVPYPHAGQFQPYAEAGRTERTQREAREPGRLTNLFRRLLDRHS